MHLIVFEVVGRGVTIAINESNSTAAFVTISWCSEAISVIPNDGFAARERWAERSYAVLLPFSPYVGNGIDADQ
jgi:hypothetical protein